MAEHEEVVIDGDSTEEDEEVKIIPQSRKRRRRSNIMVDPDEDEANEEEETQDKPIEPKPAPPRRQTQLVLGQDGFASQPMTLRTPAPMRRSTRGLSQLTISAAVARGEHGRRQEQETGKEDAGEDEEDEEDEDDDVLIIQPPSASSVNSSGRKSRRLAIQDSDEEGGPPQKAPTKELDEVEQETSSASRRSSRIHTKRQEKEAQLSSARKLDYPVLDNCLENLQTSGPHCKQVDGDEDDDDYQEEEDTEPDEAPPPPKKRRRSVPRAGDWDNREKVYADGGEDVDDFIVDDDEIEYMDDDEVGVISVESSDDEVGADDPEELTAMLEAGRSRDIDEWFAIYISYLEESIIDPELETTMRRKRSKTKYKLFHHAVDRIERKLCSCRDTVRSGVAWPEDMVDALNHASLYRSSPASREQDCEACNRRQHVATYHVDFAGAACDATKMYGANWMRNLKKSVEEKAPVQISFEMGSVCHARTLAYWQLLHAKQFWVILIDAKLKECADSTGRIGDAYRDEFVKKEFGRYKRLVELVEKFADDSKRIAVFMPNVWKGITRRKVTSDFLPLPSRVLNLSDPETRRGSLDAFVAESEEEETEDEEAVMEKMEEEKQAAARGRNYDNQDTDDEDEVQEMELSSRHRTPRSESNKEQRLQLGAKKDEDKKEKAQVQDDKPVAEKDIDDLTCLVCDSSPRNAGVVHGLYLHVYCCYACAKRQHRMKCGCLVCNRPIDRVLRLLPLTSDARNAIRNQKKS